MGVESGIGQVAPNHSPLSFRTYIRTTHRLLKKPLLVHFASVASITPLEWGKEIWGILEPVEQTAAALLNLSANMLYLETGTTNSYNEVRSSWRSTVLAPLYWTHISVALKQTSEVKAFCWFSFLPSPHRFSILLTEPVFKLHSKYNLTID